MVPLPATGKRPISQNRRTFRGTKPVTNGVACEALSLDPLTR